MVENLRFNPDTIKFDSPLLMGDVAPVVTPGDAKWEFGLEAAGMTPESEENALTPRIRRLFEEVDADVRTEASEKWMAPGHHSSYHGESDMKRVDYSRSIGEGIRQYSLTAANLSGLRVLFDAVEQDNKKGGLTQRYTVRLFPDHEALDPETVLYASAKSDGSELNWTYGKRCFPGKIAQSFESDSEYLDRMISFGLSAWNTCLSDLPTVRYEENDYRLKPFEHIGKPDISRYSDMQLDNSGSQATRLESDDKCLAEDENDAKTRYLFGEIQSFVDRMDMESRFHGNTGMLYADMPGIRFAMWKPDTSDYQVDYYMGVYVTSTGEKFRLKMSRSAHPGAKRQRTTYELRSPTAGGDTGFSCGRVGDTEPDVFYWLDKEADERGLWHSARAMFSSAWVFSDYGSLMQPSSMHMSENFY